MRVSTATRDTKSEGGTQGAGVHGARPATACRHCPPARRLTGLTLLFRLVEKLGEVAVLAKLHDCADLQEPLVHVQEHVDVRHDVRMLDSLQHLGLAQRLVAVVGVLARDLLDGQDRVCIALAPHHVGGAHATLAELFEDLILFHAGAALAPAAASADEADACVDPV